MIANARRRKSSKKRRKAKTRSKVRAKARVPRTRRRRVAKRKRGVRVSKRVGRYSHPVKANRRRKSRKARRRARRNPLMQAAANPRRRRHKRRARRNPLMQAAANPRRRRHKRRHARRNPLMQAAANGRRRRRHHRKHYASNRRHGRRTFKRNASAFVQDFVSLLKTGAVVAIGLVVQKGSTKWLAPRIASMLPASVQTFQNTVAGLPITALGMLIAAKYAPGESKKIGAGMAAGLVHTWLVDLLNYVGQTDAASYLGDYTNAPGLATHAGYGAYYQFQPGQTYSGFGGGPGVGEYFVPGTSGFGDTPQLSQAAAGTGEYIVSGAQGIGEYEQVTPEYSPRTTTRDGIRPDLSAAEHAISVAEAAAGVGMYGGLGADPDVSLQSTVYPQGQAEDIPDNPGGSRAGVFCGGNGVFGPCS